MNQDVSQTFLFEVKGQSMWPFFRGRERVVVRKTVISALRRGDLVVFRFGDKVVCHRFTGKLRLHDQECFGARPDTGWRRSEVFGADDLLGTVVGIVREDRLRPWTGPWARLADIFFFWCGPCFQILTKLRSAQRP